MGSTCPGGLHGGGGGRAHNGFEDTCEVDRWKRGERKIGEKHLAAGIKMTDTGNGTAAPAGRKEGRGEGRQRRQEEKRVAHGRAMVHRALPTRPIDSFIDSFTCSFIQYISNPDCVPDPVRGTRDAAVNKTDRVPVLTEVTDWETDITDIMK